MNSWINLNALWKIVVVGLLTGAGLPALFALGLRLLNPPIPGVSRPRTGPPPGPSATPWPDCASRWCWQRSAGASPSSSATADRRGAGPPAGQRDRFSSDRVSPCLPPPPGWRYPLFGLLPRGQRLAGLDPATPSRARPLSVGARHERTYVDFWEALAAEFARSPGSRRRIRLLSLLTRGQRHDAPTTEIGRASCARPPPRWGSLTPMPGQGAGRAVAAKGAVMVDTPRERLDAARALPAATRPGRRAPRRRARVDCGRRTCRRRRSGAPAQCWRRCGARRPARGWNVPGRPGPRPGSARR